VLRDALSRTPENRRTFKPVYSSLIGQFAGRVGIITPYKEQRKRIIREFIARYGAGITKCIEINTVDGFQGQEKDIIMLSCVRANRDGSIGFLSDGKNRHD
jgi:superfamily I DNA and/or RNA helicase